MSLQLPCVFYKKLNAADEKFFKTEVEKVRAKCVILGKGESVVV